MLEQLTDSKIQKSEQVYILPIDKIIQGSRDKEAVRFFNNLVNTDEHEKYKEQFIPLEFINDYKKTRTGINLKTGLLVGLALTYRNLRSWCAGFDEIQFIGEAVKDSVNPVKDENYRANEQACRKGMNECLEYLRLLGWR